MSYYADIFQKEVTFEELQCIEFLQQHWFELFLHYAVVYNFTQGPIPFC